jgi:hypothetical protein
MCKGKRYTYLHKQCVTSAAKCIQQQRLQHSNNRNLKNIFIITIFDLKKFLVELSRNTQDIHALKVVLSLEANLTDHIRTCGRRLDLNKARILQYIWCYFPALVWNVHFPCTGRNFKEPYVQ